MAEQNSPTPPRKPPRPRRSKPVKPGKPKVPTLRTTPKPSRTVLSGFRSAQLDEEAQEETRQILVERNSGDLAQDDPALPGRPLSIARVTDDTLDLLIVDGEIVVRAEDVGRATRLLKERGFEGPETVRCTNGCDPPDGLPIVIYKRAGATPESVRDALDALYDLQINASFNHVLPDGPAKNGATGAALPPKDQKPAESSDSDAGRGVVVAVIDTGISRDVSKRNDGFLNGIVITDENADELNAINKNQNKNNTALDLGAGHGTFVAGVVRLVAPRAEVRAYKALNSDGIGSEVGVACAILRAWRDGANIINLSLGSESYRDRPPVALEAALAMLPDDVIVVAAAGNLERQVTEQEATRPHWPAAFRRVLAVAALEEDDSPARWSQRGHWVDVATRGENVLSTYVVGKEERTRQNTDPEQFTGPNSFALWSGTSFAAPQVAGMIAAATPQTSPPRRADPRTGLAAVMAASTWYINKYGAVLKSPLT